MVSALSELQIASHPRGLAAYTYDIVNSDNIGRLLKCTDYKLSETLNHDLGIIHNVEIIGLIGDPTLRAVSWIRGGRIPNMQLYDSCLVFVKVVQEEGRDSTVHRRVFLRQDQLGPSLRSRTTPRREIQRQTRFNANGLSGFLRGDRGFWDGQHSLKDDGGKDRV